MSPHDEQEPIKSDSSNASAQLFASSVPITSEQYITGENQKIYAFHHDQKHLSLWQRFGLLPRTRQVLLVIGIISTFFIGSMIALTVVLKDSSSSPIATTNQQNKTSLVVNEDLNNDGTIDDKDALIAAGDANADGVIDGKDIDFIAADTNGDGVVDDKDNIDVSEGTSWWRDIIAKAKERMKQNSTSDTANSSTTSSSSSSEYAYIENDDWIVDDENVDDTYEYGGSSAESGTPQTNATSSGFTAATYNIRTTSADKWDNARANSILNYAKSVDIIGVQEGKDDSVSWLKTRLKIAGFTSASYSNGGEYRVIFWRNSRFGEVKQGSVKLSDGRNLTWARLKITSSGKQFYFLTTHLRLWTTTTSGGNTTSSSVYRVREIKEVLQFVKSTVGSSPVVLVGDMNSRPGSGIDDLIQAAGFRNAYSAATKKNNLSYSTSVANFNGGLSGDVHKGNSRIDNIYVKNGFSVPRVEIMIKQKGSDHIPLEADLSL